MLNFTGNKLPTTMETATPALTNYTALSGKINNLLSLKKISLKDIEGLSTLERQYLGEIATQKLALLKGAEREAFLDKIEPIMAASTKSSVWENNHQVISNAIANLMRRHDSMPTKSAIAQETGLSRQTIATHLKQYRQHPEFMAEMEQFKFMANKVLANVFKFAGNGDIKAARLYLEMVGAINKRHTGTIVNEQNNYIQINNTILSQENLKQLSPEQLNQIESIIMGRG
jgi:hypothetical protein